MVRGPHPPEHWLGPQVNWKAPNTVATPGIAGLLRIHPYGPPRRVDHVILPFDFLIIIKQNRVSVPAGVCCDGDCPASNRPFFYHAARGTVLGKWAQPAHGCSPLPARLDDIIELKNKFPYPMQSDARLYKISFAAAHKAVGK